VRIQDQIATLSALWVDSVDTFLDEFSQLPQAADSVLAYFVIPETSSATCPQFGIFV
jgi:hypothetical protein